MAAVQNKLGPHSRRLRRGALGRLADGRTWLGRFISGMERQLVEHLGGSPSVTQRLLISRLIRIIIQVDLFDEKLVAAEKGEGTWTSQDTRVYGGLQNALRLTARELGLQPAGAKPPSLAELFHDRPAA